MGEDEDDEQGAVGGNTTPHSSYGFVNPSNPNDGVSGNCNFNDFVTGGAGGGAPYGAPPPNVPYDNPYQPQAPQQPYVAPTPQAPQQPYVAPTPQAPSPATPQPNLYDNPTGSTLSVEQIAKAQKYCKWAGSALNFDDVNSAVGELMSL